jgi:CBS domain-containing protein
VALLGESAESASAVAVDLRCFSSLSVFVVLCVAWCCWAHIISYCLVSTFGKVVGIVTKKDVVRFLHAVSSKAEKRVQTKQQRRENRRRNKHQRQILPHNVKQQ